MIPCTNPSFCTAHFLEPVPDGVAPLGALILEDRAAPSNPNGDGLNGLNGPNGPQPGTSGLGPARGGFPTERLPPSNASPGKDASDVLAQLAELRALVDRLRTSYTGLESSVVDLERRAVSHKSSTSLFFL